MPSSLISSAGFIPRSGGRAPSALLLLHDEEFRGAEEEFLNAHKHYRDGRQKEAIADALKAFESTLKTICDRRSWSYDPKATAKPLLDVGPTEWTCSAGTGTAVQRLACRLRKWSPDELQSERRSRPGPGAGDSAAAYRRIRPSSSSGEYCVSGRSASHAQVMLTS